MNRNPEEVLNSVFGFESFRGRQAEIVDHVIAGGDGLVLMPTGGGKSLCYQIPALCRSGVTVVISPLIALMRDQVAALRQLGIEAAALNSSLSPGQAREVEGHIRAGVLDLVYVAPERLLKNSFLELLEHSELALFAIDEAHCVSQWGHDFRPEYRRLTVLRNRFPGVPRLALTATADGPTRRDIAESLELADGRIFVSGFDRPNIRYRVAVKESPKKQLLRFLKDGHAGDSGIVYCLSRKKVDETASMLADIGYKALPYHAGLDSAVRSLNQDRFIREDGVIIVATIAFGMGIDKPDVRFVAHMDLPKSIEAYYQETGRAGRDGLPSEAWMVYGMQDVAMQRQFVTNSSSPDEQKRIEQQKLNALLGYCETTRCRRHVMLEYLGETGSGNGGEGGCGNCDTCIEPVDSFDGTEAAQKALSAVIRTDQIFGAGHLIDLLTGGDTERIRKFGHDRLPTYGVGKDMSRREWQSIFRQLTAVGLLVVDSEGHGGLLLGSEYRPVLRGERKIKLRHDPAARKADKARADKVKIIIEDPKDEALFMKLKEKRLDIAREQGVPPYVIFHDSTLVEMALVRPLQPHLFAELPGVGEAKLKRYAETFMAIIAEHEKN